MAEGWLKSFGDEAEVFSAGTAPALGVSSAAMRVMREVGISLEGQYPKDVREFLNREFDYVITVCDNANESCPTFTGAVGARLHFGFEDPSSVTGTEEQILNAFRKTRDLIAERFRAFYEEKVRRPD
jgi:arsenate reductase